MPGAAFQPVNGRLGPFLGPPLPLSRAEPIASITPCQSASGSPRRIASTIAASASCVMRYWGWPARGRVGRMLPGGNVSFSLASPVVVIAALIELA